LPSGASLVSGDKTRTSGGKGGGGFRFGGFGGFDRFGGAGVSPRGAGNGGGVKVANIPPCGMCVKGGIVRGVDGGGGGGKGGAGGVAGFAGGV
jgi:hypothetical protein